MLERQRNELLSLRRIRKRNPFGYHYHHMYPNSYRTQPQMHPYPPQVNRYAQNQQHPSFPTSASVHELTALAARVS